MSCLNDSSEVRRDISQAAASRAAVFADGAKEPAPARDSVEAETGEICCPGVSGNDRCASSPTGSRHICINKYVRNRRRAHRQPVFESYSHLLTSLLAILCPHISCYHLSISSLWLCEPFKLLYFTFILKYSLFVPSKSSCFLTFPPF